MTFAQLTIGDTFVDLHFSGLWLKITSTTAECMAHDDTYRKGEIEHFGPSEYVAVAHLSTH